AHPTAGAEQILEQVREVALSGRRILPIGVVAALGKVAIEALLLPLLPLSIDLARVEAFALLGVFQQIISGRGGLETLGRGGVLVQVGVIGLGDLAIGFLDLGLGRVPGQAQRLVGIVHVLS